MTNKSCEERKLKASPYCTLLAPEPMSKIIQHNNTVSKINAFAPEPKELASNELNAAFSI